MVDKSDTISQPVITHSVRSHIVLVSMGERVAPFILRLLKCLYSSGVQDLTVRLFSAKSQTSQLISTLRKRVELLSTSIIQQSRNQVPQPLARYPWCKPGLHQEDTSSLQTQNHPHTQYFSVSLTMLSETETDSVQHHSWKVAGCKFLTQYQFVVPDVQKSLATTTYPCSVMSLIPSAPSEGSWTNEEECLTLSPHSLKIPGPAGFLWLLQFPPQSKNMQV